jgi:hypothetical protein
MKKHRFFYFEVVICTPSNKYLNAIPSKYLYSAFKFSTTGLNSLLRVLKVGIKIRDFCIDTVEQNQSVRQS